ncbi:metal ABC transporter permease [Spirochaetia bacterium 38H-sp]|uniref:Metal ABC transporter permease n=1 Tax=Rarispira pelagica TaxID=3141764 RepID=A0ABU9U8J1_9SPIR
MQNNFFNVLLDPSFPFLRNALIAGVLSSFLFGTLGTVVTVKRISGLAGAISHAVLGGIGMALYLSATNIVTWMSPMLGAMLFALIAAVTIGFISFRMKQREDTVINAIWAIGMSIGVLFMARTPGYTDPSTYLFGNILFISFKDLIMLAVLDLIVAALIIRFYPQIMISAFDEDFARARGIPTKAIFLIILAITAISVVLLQTFVGIIMLIAMLTLPAGTASYLAKSLSGMMILASLFSLFFSTAGIFLSWVFDLPAGAVVVVFAGLVFVFAGLIRMLLGRLHRV